MQGRPNNALPFHYPPKFSGIAAALHAGGIWFGVCYITCHVGKAAEIRREKGKKGEGVTEAGYKQILVKLNLSHQDYIFIAASLILWVVLVLWGNNFFFFNP